LTRRSPFLGPLLLFAAAVVGSLLPAPSHAQGFGQNKVQYRRFDWHILPTAHFDVYFYPGEDSIAASVALLAEQAQDKLAHDIGHRLVRRVPILLYGSHAEFEQTNVTLESLNEGVGGFTEVFKNRVVLPFMGNYRDLRHVLVHELTHAFIFDMMYGGPLEALLTRQYLFQLPLWFNEGLAEYLSIGWDSEADMFMRDGAVNGYLVPLDQISGGFLAYKEGQSALKYLVDKYGAEKLRDVLFSARSSRSLDKSFQKNLGVSVEKFSREWMKKLRKDYWPEVAQRDEGDRLFRRLTDHVNQGSYLNVNPAVSPDGSQVAFISDRSLASDIELLDTATGETVRRLVKGERSRAFESFHILRTSLCWSPDGQRIAFTAKSGPGDVLYLLDVTSGDVVEKIRLPVGTAAFPAWSPDGSRIAFVGLSRGQNDIYELTLATRAARRLTEDLAEERDLTWSPDGKEIAFSSDRGTRVPPVNLDDLAGRHDRHAIYALAVADGSVRVLVNTGGDDTNPVWSPDGKRLAYVSDKNGTSNLYLLTFETGEVLALTNVLGGVYSPTWSVKNDRIVISEFTQGGWDIFVSKEPIGNEATLAALRTRPTPTPLGIARPEPETEVNDLRAEGARELAEADSVRRENLRRSGRTPDERAESEPPRRPESQKDTLADSDELPPDSLALASAQVPRKSHRYKLRFTTDAVSGGVQYSSLIGLGASTQISLSDILGNHRIYLATDYISSLSNSDILALYYYLARRTDFGIGLFHYRQYYFSSITPLGEEFSTDRYFSTRNYGAVALASYPFTRFLRVEGDMSYITVERTDYVYDPQEDVLFAEGPITTSRVVAPTASLIHDNAVYGYYGPVSGSRWQLSYTQGLRLTRSDRRFNAMSADLRTYVPLGRQYSIALRGVGAMSNGPEAQSYFIGGPYTLRGYDFFDFRGTRIAFTNLEFRYPFVRRLDLDFPLKMSLRGIGGVAFLDAGSAWHAGESPVLFERGPDGKTRLKDLHASYGAGLRAGVAFFLVHLDFAWRLHLDRSSRMKTQLTIGEEF
jgi:Tol biopolymer transport system component